MLCCKLAIVYICALFVVLRMERGVSFFLKKQKYMNKLKSAHRQLLYLLNRVLFKCN